VLLGLGGGLDHEYRGCWFFLRGHSTLLLLKLLLMVRGRCRGWRMHGAR
jgi:hypothetical protein